MKSVIIKVVNQTHPNQQFKYAGVTYKLGLRLFIVFICAHIHIKLYNNSRSFVKNQLKPEKITIFNFNSAFFIDFFLIIFYYLRTYKYRIIPHLVVRHEMEVP